MVSSKNKNRNYNIKKSYNNFKIELLIKNIDDGKKKRILKSSINNIIKRNSKKK